MKKSVKLILAALSILLLLGAGSTIYLLYFSDWPGGMRPSYGAADYDSRLTAEAHSALPLIAAVKRYRADHLAYPPAASDLRPYLPPTSSFNGNDMVDGWLYWPENKSGFTLSRRLGWDPSLRYQSNGAEESWVFDPGDGSPQKPIVLQP